MKLGLLLALTGAALVLNLSEGRIVSKCELRQKLQQVLPLPRKYGRYKDQILALVTCELERRSKLDSNLVTGNAALPTAASRRTTQAAGGNQSVTEQDIDATISSDPMTNISRTTKMSNGVSGNPRVKRDASSEEKGHKQQGNKKRGGKKGRGNKGRDSDESDNSSKESHGMENNGANKPTASSRTTEMSNGVSGNPRLKRDTSSEERGHKQRGNKKRGDNNRGKKGRDSDESKESDNSSEEDHGMENHGANKPTASSRTTEMSNGVSGNPRVKRDASSEERGHKQQGNKKRGDNNRGKKGRDSDESDESGESRQKNKKEKKHSKHTHESSSQEEYNIEPSQGSSSYFGLFQLLDSFFCDSGNGLSKNLCGKNCSAFVDDDITDDLECFAYKGYWRSILDEVSSSCSDQQDIYFDECD